MKLLAVTGDRVRMSLSGSQERGGDSSVPVSQAARSSLLLPRAGAVRVRLVISENVVIMFITELPVCQLSYDDRGETSTSGLWSLSMIAIMPHSALLGGSHTALCSSQGGRKSHTALCSVLTIVLTTVLTTV